MVAFYCVCQDKIPKVPCSTALDNFSIVNHCTILVVRTVVPFYSAVANVGDNEGRTMLGTQIFMGAKVEDEQGVGAVRTPTLPLRRLTRLERLLLGFTSSQKVMGVRQITEVTRAARVSKVQKCAS